MSGVMGVLLVVVFFLFLKREKERIRKKEKKRAGFLLLLKYPRLNKIGRKPARTVADLASARQHQESPAGRHGARARGGGVFFF